LLTDTFLDSNPVPAGTSEIPYKIVLSRARTDLISYAPRRTGYGRTVPIPPLW